MTASNGSSFDLVKVILAGTTAFLALLTLIFIILFATKSTKSTSFIVSFQGDLSQSAANDAIEKAFKDAKYTVRDVQVQKASDGSWKGVVLLKGKQKEDDVISKVAKSGVYSQLYIAPGSKAAEACAHSPVTPPATTIKAQTTTPTPEVQSTSSAEITSTRTPTTTPAIIGWCDENGGGPRDYVFVIDTIFPALDKTPTKDTVFGKILDEMILRIPANARYAFLTTSGDKTTTVMGLTDDVKTLKASKQKVVDAFNAASSDDRYADINYAAVYNQINGLKKDMKSSRPVSVVVITDHPIGPDSGKFFDIRMHGYFLSAVVESAVFESYSADRFSISPLEFSYKTIDAMAVKTQMCTVTGELSAPPTDMKPLPTINQLERPEPMVLDAKRRFDCLTHDIVLVFDETQSIYNKTIDDWKTLSYKIIDDFKMLDELDDDDDQAVFTRFSVVVFGGLENRVGNAAKRQEDESDDKDYTSTILLYLDNATSAEGVKAKISQEVYVYNGLTNITSALDAVQHVFDSAQPYAGADYNRTEKRIVITMTDGFLTADEQTATKAQAQTLRDKYKADLWFVLAEKNVIGADFPSAYQFAVELTGKPQRVFNSSDDAMDGQFDLNYAGEYPCPPKRCKVVYFACENTEVLDPLIKGQSNRLCIEESLRLADSINQGSNNVTFRFLLYSTPDLTTIYPPQGEDDSYENFVAQVTPLLDFGPRDQKHGGYTYLANALRVIAGSFLQYSKKNPLVDGALIIGGQYEKGKIEDWSEVKGAVAQLKYKFQNFFVMDRSDPGHKEPYDDPDFGWGVVAPIERIMEFKGDYDQDVKSLTDSGFFDLLDKLDCSLPPIEICEKMYDVQFAIHFADIGDTKMLNDQKDIVKQLISQFKASYPVHLGAYFIGQEDKVPDQQLGLLQAYDINTLIDQNVTTTNIHDMSIWDHVIANRFIANTGCELLNSTSDRANVDNVLVLVSNEWRKWSRSAWRDVKNHLEGWKCKDCPNYPKFIFVDLNQRNSTDDDYPDGMKDEMIYWLHEYNLQLRESYNQLNTVVRGICTPLKRDCCVDYKCKPYTGQAICGQPSFVDLISKNQIPAY